MFAEHHRFETDYRSCPRHQQVACPQDLQAARGLKADELGVSWQPIDHANLLGGAAVTVIVEAGDETVVGTVPVAATRAPFSALPRNSELDIAAALTRQGHVISEVCRIRLRSTQTRTDPRTRDTTSSSASVAVTPPTVPPPVPTVPSTTPSLAAVDGLTVADTDARTSRDLTWTAPASTTDIANFEIQHCSDAGCTGTPTVAGTPAASAISHTVTGLTRNTAYHFRIRAVAAQGSGYTDSAWSPTVEGRTAKEPLPVVNGLAVADTDAHTSRDLTWTAPVSTTGMAHFEIQRCSDAGCTGTPTAAGTPVTTATSHTVTSLTRNTAYHFRIRAVATSGSDYADSAWSTTVEGRTAKEPLPALSNVAGYTTGIQPDQAGIGWDALTHTALASYEVEVCANAACTGTPTHTATPSTSTTHYYYACTAGTTCHFRIRAKATSTSDYSDGLWSSIIAQTGHVGN